MRRRELLGAAALIAATTTATTVPTLAQAAGRTTAATQTTPKLPIIDRFGRDVTSYGIQLVDWEGYLANPYISLTLTGPASGLTYPLSIELRALGTSRLMMDLPSELTASGAVKQLQLTSRASKASFRLAIHPRRDPGADELHRLEVHVRDAAGRTLVQQTPIRVQVDKKDPPTAPIPLVFDRRYDTITTTFADAGVRTATEAAITDWYSHFDLTAFDPVARGAERITLPGNNWADPVAATNDAAYTGMWVFLRGIAEPYSTGFPATNGSLHTVNQQPTPYHRSTALILQFAAGAEVFTSIADEDWWQTDLYRCVDVYGLAMHEYGHALAYNQSWDGMAAYHDGGWQTATSVIAYQGRAVPLDSSYHIPGDEPYWDRLSGQSGGWSHLFPTRRWMPTKLSLLIAESAGWKLDRTRTAFLDPAIVTTSVPRATRGTVYRTRLKAQGGVPFYDWQVVGGSLPTGLSLSRFTGTISGTPTTAGTFSFVVRLRDYDALQTPRLRTYTLTVTN